MECKTKTNKMKEASNEWEQLDKNRPLWVLKPEDTTYNKYNMTPASSYESLLHDWEHHVQKNYWSAEHQR
eukprot:13043967-Heterocapsa_arctica.AAC.1